MCVLVFTGMNEDGDEKKDQLLFFICSMLSSLLMFRNEKVLGTDFSKCVSTLHPTYERFANMVETSIRCDAFQNLCVYACDYQADEDQTPNGELTAWIDDYKKVQ
jgi:hypothetical protein